MSNSPILGLTMMSASQAQKEVVFNNFLIAMDALFRGSVLDATLSAPPASPNLGDAYVIAAGGSGAWSGEDHCVTFYFNGWQFVTPPTKLRMYSVAQSAYFTFQGLPAGWTEDPQSAVSVLNDLTNVAGTPANGQVLVYNATTAKWGPGNATFTAALSALTDVTITEGAPINGYALVWNETALKWEAGPVLSAKPALLSLPDVTSTGAQLNWVLAYNPVGPSVQFIAPTSLTLVTSLSQVKDVTYPTGGSGAIPSGDVLTWNGAGWAPAAPTGGSGGGGSSTLAGDSDVDIMTPANNQVLTYQASSNKWINATPSAGATALSALTDVNVTEAGLTNGYLLSWSSSTSKWVATAPPSGGSGGGSSTLAGDSDVSISSPTNGQVLTYNTAANKWENAAAPGGGAGGAPTALTLEASVSAFGMTVYPAEQTFTLAANERLEIFGYIYKVSANVGTILASIDGTTAYSMAVQGDGNYVVYRNNGSSNSPLAACGGSGSNNYTGLFEIGLVVNCQGASNNEVYGSANGYFSNRSTDTNVNVAGTVTVYVETDNPALCVLFARIVSASTVGYGGSGGSGSGGSSTLAGDSDVAVSLPANNQMLLFSASAAKWQNVNTPYNLSVGITGLMTSSEIVLQYVFPYAVTFPASLTGSYATANTAATAAPSITINKNGSSVGSIAWSASGKTGAFTFASAVSFAAGDVLQLVAPATPDATLADIGVTLAGHRS